MLSSIKKNFTYHLNFACKLPFAKTEIKLAQLTWSDDCCSKIQASIFLKYF
ncbi:hypothetical protein D1BOALGB6SA_10604 [Olavius sp. associated proteobacterium Delta 1]|nr:hypothetical protein D1BOALGB6SA_10604 [Olavius sp. associated proteobacterium Delta 1]